MNSEAAFVVYRPAFGSAMSRSAFVPFIICLLCACASDAFAKKPAGEVVEQVDPGHWLRFQTQSTGLCAGLGKGRVRHQPFGVGGGRYVLHEGVDLAVGARDFRCTGQNPLVLGARGELAYTTYETTRRYSEVIAVEPRATKIAWLGNDPCLLLDDGTIRCPKGWDGRPSAYQPVTELFAARGKVVDVLDQAPCALFDNGDLVCGFANSKELGKPWPNVRQASIFESNWQLHGCVVLNDGTVECVGDNRYGQRGAEGKLNPATPNKVAGLSNIVEVASSGVHACARDKTGAVFCWGKADSRELGNQGFDAAKKLPRCPVDEAAMKRAREELRALKKQCDRKSSADDDLRRDDPCGRMLWNYERSGGLQTLYKQDGVCETMQKPVRYLATPIRVREVSGVTALAARSELTCALSRDQRMTCWGFSLDEPRTVKLPATTLTDPRPRIDKFVANVSRPSLSVSPNSGICARTAKGSLARVGLVKEGVFGSAVKIAPEVQDVFCSPYLYCERLHDGSSRCFGPDGARVEREGTSIEPGKGVLLTMYGELCVLRDDGVLKCGPGYGGNMSTRVGHALSAWAPIASTLSYAPCARFADDTVGCLGKDTYGAPDILWSSVKDADGTFAAPQLNGCAVMNDGTVQCLGDNARFQRAVKGQPKPEAPNVVEGIADAEEIASNGTHVCVRHKTGEVSCWGEATRGQTGPVAFAKATKVPFCGLDKEAMSTERERLRESDKRCRGENPPEACRPTFYLYKPGCETPADGVLTSFFEVPQKIAGVTNAVAIAVGHGLSCALLADDRVACWGGGSPEVRRFVLK